MNAALVIAERFGDDEVNALSFHEVEAVLMARFAKRFPDARSVSADLNTLRKGNDECPQRSIRSV